MIKVKFTFILLLKMPEKFFFIFTSYKSKKKGQNHQQFARRCTAKEEPLSQDKSVILETHCNVFFNNWSITCLL